MRILGLDLSLTATGIALLENGALVTADTLKPPAKIAVAARLDWFCERAVGFATDYDVDLAAIEGYSFGSFAGREVLGELGGVIRLELWRERIPYIVIQPTAWRKRLTGRGNLKKDMVGLELHKRYGAQLAGHEFPTLDALEAWAVAYCAWLDHKEAA